MNAWTRVASPAQSQSQPLSQSYLDQENESVNVLPWWWVKMLALKFHYVWFSPTPPQRPSTNLGHQLSLNSIDLLAEGSLCSWWGLDPGSKAWLYRRWGMDELSKAATVFCFHLFSCHFFLPWSHGFFSTFEDLSPYGLLPKQTKKPQLTL